MKFSLATTTLVALVSSVSAFAPSHHQQQRTTTTKSIHDKVAKNSQLQAVVTGVKGKPAASREEDLMLTLQVIMDHEQRSTTVSKEQYVQQVEKAKKESDNASDPVDVSVPYDAAARLAYEASDKSVTFEEFEVKYLADAVALVKSKQPVDLSIPYDAAAKLAYEQSDKSMSFADFKPKYLAEAVELVKSKQPVDLSIPYDAAAKLAYEKSDKSMPFPEFEKKYKADAVADVIAKRK
ncbi:hypothetical protein IV203_037977 [Nitzschia inconspicua]|uniref:Uncharacterized protein n=1 Tax=Nitzschia inconspicua TaxID=303405 RepID=A0A9K3LLR1_9STRA|nr:hypothetical protein IV203_037977 [Nitzschia inconspicua]